MAVGFGFDTELFTCALPTTDGRGAAEADVVVATPSTGKAWLLTFTYNACGRTALFEVDGDDDVETAAPLVFAEETPLHWVDGMSLADVPRQGRFGSAL